ncbi:MAG TPA: hypothetical protein VI776_17075 [Anaerolineales bacterium]|nr:hypothetical protein [Anaerolineales bacterium]
MAESSSHYSQLLKNRINLRQIPFSERGSCLMVFFENQHFSIRLAERWIKLNNECRLTALALHSSINLP